MALVLLVYSLIFHFALANVVLPSNWVNPAYGTCTAPPIAGMERAGPPYSGANADWKIAEGVVSGSVGVTCNFNPGGKAFSQMPQLYKDGYLLAASQDLYNGLPLSRTGWGQDCSRAESATDGRTCAQNCGVCMLVSGPKGSAVFIVNEIADVPAVGQNGDGLNLHLDHRQSAKIRDYGGVSKDISFKRVPCPVEGSIYVSVWGNWGAWAMYFVVYNYRYAVKHVHIRSTGNTWVLLPRDWTNRWKWENKGSIIQGATDGKTTEMRITSVNGEVLTCVGIGPHLTAGSTMECKDSTGKGQQFDVGSVSPQQSCSGSAVQNLNYYKNLPSGPTNPPPSNPPPSNPPTSNPPTSNPPPSNPPPSNPPPSNPPSTGYKTILETNFDDSNSRGFVAVKGGGVTILDCGSEGKVLRPNSNSDIRWEFSNSSPVSRVRVTIRFGFMDSWDNEAAYLKVKDQEIWRVNDAASSHSSNFCGKTPASGQTWWNDRFESVTRETTFSTPSNQVKVDIGTTLNQGLDDEWYCISSIKVEIVEAGSAKAIDDNQSMYADTSSTSENPWNSAGAIAGLVVAAVVLTVVLIVVSVLLHRESSRKMPERP